VTEEAGAAETVAVGVTVVAKAAEWLQMTAEILAGEPSGSK